MQNQRCRVDQRPNADFSRVHGTEVDGNSPPPPKKKRCSQNSAGSVSVSEHLLN